MVEWVSEFLIPTIKLLLFTFLMGWILFVFYWIFKRVFPDFRWWFKYSILKKPYNDKIIEWCIQADDLDLTEEDVMRRFLLQGGYTPKSVKEIGYIYQQVKELKGGVSSNGQKITRSNRQVKQTKIPKF